MAASHGLPPYRGKGIRRSYKARPLKLRGVMHFSWGIWGWGQEEVKSKRNGQCRARREEGREGGMERRTWNNRKACAPTLLLRRRTCPLSFRFYKPWWIFNREAEGNTEKALIPRRKHSRSEWMGNKKNVNAWFITPMFAMEEAMFRAAGPIAAAAARRRGARGAARALPSAKNDAARFSRNIKVKVTCISTHLQRNFEVRRLYTF